MKETVDFNDPDIKFACDWAKKRHDDTYAIRNHSGNMYWEHPEGVAKLACAYGGDKNEVIAAVCHDTVEDTDATFEEVEVLFGGNIADIIAEVTNDKLRIAEVGKERAMNEELISLSTPALFVKLCDIFYNLLDYPSDKQKERMIRNMKFLIKNRDIPKKCYDLTEDIMGSLKN